MTTQPEHLQCPLMEMDTISSLYFVYRYDSTTGTFTVPSDGDGFYYFSVYLSTVSGESAYFDLEINGESLCSAVGELTQISSGDEIVASCSGIAQVVEGNMLTLQIQMIL